MDEYARERESRRRTRSIGAALFIVIAGAALAVKVGVVVAGAGVVVLLLIAFGLPALLSGGGRSREAGRRSQGEVPSWPAQLPAGSAMNSGYQFRHRISKDTELLGRLYYDGSTWTWQASKRMTSSYGIRSLSWDSSWSMAAQPTWGPGGQGHVQLTRPGDSPIDLWVRGVDDLMRTCRGASR